MNPVVELFVKKYAAGILLRGAQAVGVWLIAKHKFDPNDVVALQNSIDWSAVVGWCMTVGPEAYHAWSNKDHATIKVANTTSTDTQKPVPAHGATGLTVAMLLLGCVVSNAQTTALSTNSPLTNSSPVLVLPGLSISGINTNVVAAANDLMPIIEQMIPFLTNGNLTLTGDALYDGQHWGGLGDLEVPIPGATNWLSLGVGAAYADNDWYAFVASVKVSQVVNIPVVNQPLYVFAETGLADRIRDSALGDQTAVGGAFVFKLSSKVQLIADGGRLELTQTGVPGQWFGGLRINLNLK